MTASMEVPFPRERVFSFFANAENLGRITPPELHFRIDAAGPIPMCQGTVIDYTIRLWGWPLRWRSRITRWNPPEEFVDEQAIGPYRKWIHRHLLRETATGTRIEDEVIYALPGWPLGELFAPVIRGQLRRIFEFRKRAVAGCFQQEPPP